MASNINTKQENTAGSGSKPWIQLNRYMLPYYTVSIIVTGVVTYQIEGTLARLNRGEAEESFILDDAAGFPISGEATTKTFQLSQAPIEFIRINQTAGAGSLVFRVMQSGLLT